ncbi:MAG TPA: acyl-CoA dehydrogenase family protein [Acidimicrobiales bacterium]|jgi:alkylation response protein AidB-like acyl-CoA dehydrogenase
MNLSFTEAEEAFRLEARAYLEDRLGGPFSGVRHRGGPGDEHVLFEERLRWERELGAEGWTCLSWPTRYGGQGRTFMEQVIFYEEYARAGGPGRVGLIGEGLIGPTILHYGTDGQKRRFLPKIASGEEMWCQGYSEPEAGSDLANIATKARLDGGEWVIDGQKVWTSLAQWSQWCFVLARTTPGTPKKHQGISYLLVPMDQVGIEVRPIIQLTGTSEFNEVFFSGARTASDLVVGEPGEGWAVAMGTLAFERGALTLGQQLEFTNELRQITGMARSNGMASNPPMRDRLARLWGGLMIMRWSALRGLSQLERPEPGPQAMVSKLYWATWHRELGNLAMDVLGVHASIAGETAPPDVDERGVAGYDLTRLQRLFLFTRADTIYGGSNEIQRNIIGERALGLPREPR